MTDGAHPQSVYEFRNTNPFKILKSRKALCNSINPFSNNQQELLMQPLQQDLSGWALLHLHLSSVRPPKKAVGM